MSLQVWLPLNGNLENQGLFNVNTQNLKSTTFTAGKIGQGLNLITDGQGVSLVNYMNECSKYSNYSMAAWVYLDSTATNHSSTILSSGDWNNGASQCCFAFYSYNSGYERILVPNRSGWDEGINVNSKILLNKWYHIAITYDGSNTKAYINGEYVGSYPGGGITSTSNNADLYIGRATYYDGFTLKGKLNDVRVYDHCLSTKEIKELAKGLVLHYRLAGPGQANLTKGNNTYERNSASTDGCFWFSGSNFNCKPSTTYTLSIDIDGTISNFHGGSASTDPAKRWASMWFYLCKTGTSTNAAGGDYDSPINLNSTNYNFRKIGPTRYAWTYTTPADARSLSIRGNTYSNGTDAIKVKFWNPKIEEGTIATPWCPRSDESIYTSLGYNNNIEYDCSGYLRNGTQNGNFTWSADSPRYATSYLKTSNSKPLINVPTVFVSGASIPEITMACWWKSDSTTSADRKNLISLGANNFIRFGPNSSTTEWIYCTGTTATITIPNCMDMKWHHHVITFKGGVFSVYFDGELKGTQATSLSAIACSDTTNYIGAYGSSSEIVPGAFSDARVYATALSANDIAELYHSAVIVDNTGKNYAYEYFEA